MPSQQIERSSSRDACRYVGHAMGQSTTVDPPSFPQMSNASQAETDRQKQSHVYHNAYYCTWSDLPDLQIAARSVLLNGMPVPHTKCPPASEHAHPRMLRPIQRMLRLCS